MFLVTNREPKAQVGGPDILGKEPNHKGANELRLVEARRRSGKWTLTVLPDTISADMQLDAGTQNRHVVNYVASKLFQRINPQAANPNSTKRGKNLLVFVHGFNNDVEDVLERAYRLSRLYGVEVLPFTWPANGGGKLSGTASYKSDKRDARLSVGALDRVLREVGRRMNMLIEERREEVIARAKADFPNNLQARDAFIVRALELSCPFTVNLLAHSMGVYLYKHLLLSTASEGKGLVFDNVILAAADTNNEDHERWVDQIRARRRVYITINEDDRALQVSRVKSGEEQRARLGHYPFNLVSHHAAYVQFTDARKVGSSHAYFEGEPTENAKIKGFFKEVFRGNRGDRRLTYDSGSNTYRL